MKVSRKLKDRLTAFLKTKKGQTAALVMAGAAAVLLVLGDALPHAAATPTVSTPSIEESEQDLERRLEDLLGRVDGVGKCRVMITLERSVETVYGTETKSSGETAQTGEKHETEETYILLENASGDRSALPRFHERPPVRGVLVVCAGGNTASVRAAVTQAVSAALGVGSDRVCVVRGD